jgi:hypothetical protein
MELPQIRPGKVPDHPVATRVVAFFPNASQGNAVIQLLPQIGVPADGIAVTPPERIERGQGMLLAIACPEVSLVRRVEDICRAQGAEIRRQRA